VTYQIPIGPETVGHESEVLPYRATVSRRLNETRVSFKVPQCRYGCATYRAEARVPEYDRLGRRYACTIRTCHSGEDVTLEVSSSRPDCKIVLVLTGFILDGGAFDGFTDDELIDALSHEVEDVREAAVLALSRRTGDAHRDTTPSRSVGSPTTELE